MELELRYVVLTIMLQVRDTAAGKNVKQIFKARKPINITIPSINFLITVNYSEDTAQINRVRIIDLVLCPILF